MITKNDLNFLSRYMYNNQGEIEHIAKYFDYIKNYLSIEHGIGRASFRKMNFVTENEIKVTYVDENGDTKTQKYGIVPYSFFDKYMKRQDGLRDLGI